MFTFRGQAYPPIDPVQYPNFYLLGTDSILGINLNLGINLKRILVNRIHNNSIYYLAT